MYKLSKAHLHFKYFCQFTTPISFDFIAARMKNGKF